MDILRINEREFTWLESGDSVLIVGAQGGCDEMVFVEGKDAIYLWNMLKEGRITRSNNVTNAGRSRVLDELINRGILVATCASDDTEDTEFPEALDRLNVRIRVKAISELLPDQVHILTVTSKTGFANDQQPGDCGDCFIK